MNIVEKNIDDLKFAEYNPRKINGKQLDDLKKSIKKFGLQEPFLVNTYKGRENVLISGHQRSRACRELGITMVPCVELKLNPEEEKELNIRMNKNGGEFDFNLLNEYFEKEELLDFGFLEQEFPADAIEEAIKEFTEDDNPIYPIVPVLSEKYNYVVIVAENEIDNAFLENYFELENQKSYKNSKVGIGRVLSFDKFRKLVENDKE